MVKAKKPQKKTYPVEPPTEEQMKKIIEWVEEEEIKIKQSKKKRERVFLPVTEEEEREADAAIAEWEHKILTGQTSAPMEPGKADFPIGLD